MIISRIMTPRLQTSTDQGWLTSDKASICVLWGPVYLLELVNSSRTSGGIYSGVAIDIFPESLKWYAEPKSIIFNLVKSSFALFVSRRILSGFKSECTIP